MGILLNGNKPSKIIYNGVETALYYNGSKIWPEGDPYNPLNLPANTVRVRTSNGNVPVKKSSTTYETATLVPGTTDVYDVYKSGTNFKNFLYQSTNVVEILGANTTGITDMSYMFFSCSSLTSISLFDTSSVINMSYMFYSCTLLTTVPLFDTSSVINIYDIFDSCTSLTTVPLFDTSSVTNMSSMFYNCRNVQSGALALYQQASTQTTPPAHNSAFYRCGANTTTGAAELAQIPSGWK